MTSLKLSPDELRTGTLELLCYLLASARGVIYEPRLYAPYRLAEGARRLILLMDQAGIATVEWRTIADDIQRHVMNAITNEEECKTLLDKLVLQVTAQLKEHSIGDSQ